MQKVSTIDKLFYRELGKEIRELRQHRGMTLQQLSKMTGISRSLIDHWELGFSKIKPAYFERLCDALQVSSEINITISIGYWRK